LVFATLVRHDLHPSDVRWGGVAAMVPFVCVGQLAAGMLTGLYRGRWRVASFDEVAAIVMSVALTTAVAGAVVVAAGSPHLVPRGAIVAGGFVAIVLMAGSRYMWRRSVEHHLRPRDARSRVLVFGAGDGGVQVLTAMLHSPTSPYVPIALLDDDQAKHRLKIMGIPVLGGRDRLLTVARERRADTLLIAIPSAGHELVTEVSDLAFEAGLAVLVLPSVVELFNGSVGVRDIRPLSAEDLLGRRQVDIDIGSIAGYLTDKRVLVTGAGGSIGSELCRQIWRYAPARLIMLDRNENALHAVQLSIEGRALLETENLALLCIRDQVAVEEAFAQHEPQVVFHAAALKHLPLLERHPSEAVKTNVLGTLYVLESAVRHGVQRFVNISTDKAADPISVLGFTKRIAERLTASAAEQAPGTFLSVRFGNVLGSDGSVQKAFETQIAVGGPITVTDPDVTRYFMTVGEAVQLVIQAAAIGEHGQTLVLDMGDAVRIADLARRLTANSPRPIKIVYTGLRPGEKLHERLLGRAEEDRRPGHPLISQVVVPPLDVEQVAGIDADADAHELVSTIRRLALSDVEAFET
jgi:FlaA1/EpsC-like NDP-sugar epimerase